MLTYQSCEKFSMLKLNKKKLTENIKFWQDISTFEKNILTNGKD